MGRRLSRLPQISEWPWSITSQKEGSAACTQMFGINLISYLYIYVHMYILPLSSLATPSWRPAGRLVRQKEGSWSGVWIVRPQWAWVLDRLGPWASSSAQISWCALCPQLWSDFWTCVLHMHLHFLKACPFPLILGRMCNVPAVGPETWLHSLSARLIGFIRWPFCPWKGCWHKKVIATSLPAPDFEWLQTHRSLVSPACSQLLVNASASINSEPSMMRGIPAADCGFIMSSTWQIFRVQGMGRKPTENPEMQHLQTAKPASSTVVNWILLARCIHW